VVNWHVLALVLVGDILLLLLVEDYNTTGAGGERHITYFDHYINNYGATGSVWLKNCQNSGAEPETLRLRSMKRTRGRGQGGEPYKGRDFVLGQ
jgi:hypothetical protein